MTHEHVSKMQKNKSLGISKGTFFNLQSYDGNTIQCVLEQQQAEVSSNLPDNLDYGNLKLRNIIYENATSGYYLLYAPLIAVNETDYDIILQDKKRD